MKTTVRSLTLRRDRAASSEGITSVAGEARARRQMVHDLALGVLAAGTGAWILALVPDARSIRGAVTVEDAFRPAAFVRVADVLWEASARTGTVLFSANGVRTTRRRLARCGFLLYNRIG